MITPEVGQRYRLGDEVVEVVEAQERRKRYPYWHIVVRAEHGEIEPGKPVTSLRTVKTAEWAAKAERVGS